MNSLEWIEWESNPVQLILCDACGTVGCNSGCYVHVSRLEDFVLLTAPQINADDDWESTQYAPHFALESLGAIAISDSIWEKWRELFPTLPKQSAFPQATGRTLADAWTLGPGRPKRIDRLLPMLSHRMLACDSLAPHVAVTRVEGWLNYLLSFASVPIPVTLKSPGELGAKLETFYFDGPSGEDWVALALVGERDYVVLDSKHVLVLAPQKPWVRRP